jgi:transcriptional regulator with XRE-family HTH domain
MTSSAEIRTQRHALGISARTLAERSGVHLQTIWQVDRGQLAVPERVSDALASMANDWEAASDRLTAEMRSQEEGAIPRYRTIEEFESAVPELAGWSTERGKGDVQSLLLADVQRRTRLPIEWADEIVTPS